MTEHHHLDNTQISLLVDRLDQIAGWVTEELDNAITGQTVFRDKTLGTPGSNETPLAFNERASDFAHELLGTLRAWTNHVATQRGLPWPGDGRTPHYARWLSTHVYDLARTDQADDAYTEIIGAYEAVFNVIDRPKVRERYVDDEKVDQCRDLELSARDCVQVAKRLGRWHNQLTQTRIKNLTKANVLTPLHQTRVSGTLTNIYRLGDVLAATRIDDEQPETR